MVKEVRCALRTFTLQRKDGGAMVKRKRKKKKLKYLIIFLVLAGGGYAFYHFRMAGKKVEDVDTPVSLKKGVVVDRLTETGKVEYERIVEVKSAISGRVKTLLVDDGQEVNANDVMAVIGPDPDQALRLSEAAVSVKRSRIVWKQKEKEYQRLSQLFEKQLISKEQLEDSKDELDLSKYNYELAQLQLSILEEEVGSENTESSNDMPGETPFVENPGDEEDVESEIQLQDFRVQAPLSGVVLTRNVEEGDMVIRGTSAYTQGHTLFRIGDPRKIIVSSMINEIDVPKLSVGMPVKIIPNADEQRTYQGKIEKISPQGINVNGIIYYRVEIVVLKPDSFLKQEMTCDVDVVLGEKEDVSYLPVEAVLKVYRKDKEGKETKQIDKYMVFKKTGSKYEKVEIKVGLKSESRMEILDGLMPEDKVHPDAEKMEKKEKKKDKEEESTTAVTVQHS
jgi:multidrug efflux pump subunit AcrA (membrane-fusion protein)